MFFREQSYKAIVLLCLSCISSIYLLCRADNIKNLELKGEKHIIQGRSRLHGFFAAFGIVLSHIDWCERNGRIPVVYWDQNSLYYTPEGYNGSVGNAWEYYFYPVSHLSYSEGDPIHKDIFPPDGSFAARDISSKNRKKINEIIKRYIKVKPPVMEKVNAFYEKNMRDKKTIGIHLRGTDKITEVPRVPLHLIMEEANKYKDYQFFVATDEEALLEQAKTMLRGRVIYYPACRSKFGDPIHFSSTCNKAQVGEEVLIESILLSKCDKFIHTSSWVAFCTLFFNPTLENIFFDTSNWSASEVS